MGYFWRTRRSIHDVMPAVKFINSLRAHAVGPWKFAKRWGKETQLESPLLDNNTYEEREYRALSV